MPRHSVAEPADLAPSPEELATSSVVDDIPVGDGTAIADTALEQPGPREPEDTAPAVDAEETAAASPQQQQPNAGTVDVRALQEARAELREARRVNQVLEQRWNDFLAGQHAAGRPQQAAEPEKMPGDDDPIGQLKWLKDHYVADQQQRQQQAEQQQRISAEEARWREAETFAAQSFAAAVQENPGVQQAYEALKGSIASELQAMGYAGPALQQAFTQIERSYIAHIVNNRLDVGQFILSMAKARGAVAPQQQQQTGAQQPRGENGQFRPRPADPQTMAQQQERHRSLSDAPGGAAPAQIDAKALAKMSDKEFKAWMSNKSNEKAFEAIMGES